MARQLERRARGAAKDAVAVHLRIPADVKAKLERVADALGKSQSQVLELIIANTEVDADGRPSFWEGHLPIDTQTELPLPSAS